MTSLPVPASFVTSAPDSVLDSHTPQSPNVADNSNGEKDLGEKEYDAIWSDYPTASIACESFKGALDNIGNAVLETRAEAEREMFDLILDDEAEDIAEALVLAKIKEKSYWAEHLPPIMKRSVVRFHMLEMELENLTKSHVGNEQDQIMTKYLKWLMERGAEAMVAGWEVLKVAQKAGSSEQIDLSATLGASSTYNPIPATQRALMGLNGALEKIEEQSQSIFAAGCRVYQERLEARESPASAKKALIRYQHLHTFQNIPNNLEHVRNCAYDVGRLWAPAEVWVRRHFDRELEEDKMGKIKNMLYEDVDMREEAIVKAAKWVLKNAEWHRDMKNVIRGERNLVLGCGIARNR
ncbi:hypothetical protein N0V90_004535 [Kalmusia sp. IMI 367209]|nr:hypothetical protein N0V90_004535 [Kalmusia sp. IMI 367209]